MVGKRSSPSGTVSGGCLCGSVRYESSSQPGFAVICHCRQCQHITGTGHAAQFALPAGKVTLRGQLSEFKMKADSGREVTSAFCPICGSPIYKQSSGYAHVMFFHAATLDQPALFKPQQAVWTSQKQSWDLLDESLPATP